MLLVQAYLCIDLDALYMLPSVIYIKLEPVKGDYQ